MNLEMKHLCMSDAPSWVKLFKEIQHYPAYGRLAKKGSGISYNLRTSNN